MRIRGWLEECCIYREKYAIQCWETRPYAVGVASSQAEAFYRAVAVKLQEEASALNERRSRLYRMVPKRIRAPPDKVADPFRAIPTSVSESQPKT